MVQAYLRNRLQELGSLNSDDTEFLILLAINDGALWEWCCFTLGVVVRH